MKRLFALATLLVVGCTFFMPRLPASDPPLGDTLWNEVQKALDEGRLQTALERLDPIARRADANGDVPEKIRVLVTRIHLELMTSDQPADARLKKLRAAIDASDPAMKPVLEAIQASWMWEFFQQHRWKFGQRTAVAQPAPQGDRTNTTATEGPPPSIVPGPDDDLLTWDLQRILAVIDDQFQRSLQAAETLKNTPIADYKLLLTPGNVPENYRPTMYDVLAQHALQFYTAGEQAGSRSINAFDLLADSPIFGSEDDFIAWKPQAVDQRAPLLRAVKLYQDLLAFHQGDDDPSARLDIDIARLAFGYNHALGDEKAARFKAALERIAAAHSSHPISAIAQATLVERLMDAQDFVAAHRLAKQVIERIPDSVGSRRCFNAIQQIELPDLQASTERVWNAPWPTVDVDYRNLKKVYFRLVPLDFEEFVQTQRWQPEALDDEQHKRLLAAQPVRAWSSDLPPTDDYRKRSHQVAIPTDVPKGAYFLVASAREDFTLSNNQLSLCEVWVSNLTIIPRTTQGNGIIRGHVFDARDGKPVAGATVQAWEYNHTRPRGRISGPKVQTNQDGEFQFPEGNRGQVVLLASQGDDRLSSAGYLSSAIHQQAHETVKNTQFFTDRAIYRPGQTIRYKGIAHQYNQESDQYNVLPNTSLTVALMDANGQEVERFEHRTNDYGSFSGSFTAPKGRLMGVMTIHVLTGPHGTAQIHVEEYKRPKFEVKLESPKEGAKLGENVSVPGSAMAYTGATVGDASVSWRVVRAVRYPPWWFWRCWWMPPSQGDSQEIARGTTTTDADGKFSIEFTAKPDLSVSPESEPTFHYTIYADVTDGTGETRSDQRSVSAGYTALSASIATAGDVNWLTTEKQVELKISTTTLDGDAQAAEGTLKVYALKQPEKVVRPPLSLPWHRGFVFSSEDEPPKDLSNPSSWPLGEVVFESAFKTDATGAQKLSVELPAGIYRATLATKDRYGKEVTAELPLEVFDVKAPKWPVNVANRVVFEKTTIEPGQTLKGLWASGYDNSRVFVEIEHRGKMIKGYWTSGNESQHLIELPIAETMRGGVTIHTTFVHENRAYLESHRIDVPWTNKDLDISWERFVSKLGPAQKETWTAVIKGNDAEHVAAEMVATLYDASLDVFAPHHWMSRFGVFRYDYSRIHRSYSNQLKSLGVFRYDWRSQFQEVSWFYPQLNFPRMGYGYEGVMMRQRRNMGRGAPSRGMPAPMMDAAMEAESMPASIADTGTAAKGLAGGAFGRIEISNAPARDDNGGGTGEPQISLEGIPVRTNLSETAFFFPHVLSSEDGVVKLEFTMPEALTRWRFMGFAHDKNLRGGLLSDNAVTSKDLMIQPNPPRFLREGDVLEMTVKVTNLSATRQTGSAALNFFDPQTGESLDASFDNASGPKPFDIPASGTQAIAWRIKVPDGVTLVTYRAVASSGRLSDGEEGYLPVLSRRVLVTESLALPIRGKQTKEYDFKRLLDSAQSDTLTHQSLTVQMASNPAWYAVLSLPYLMEYPYECSEQIFNRLYANSLARRIATSDPKIEQIFEQWRGTEALASPLTKNEDVKSTVLEESPWVRQAQAESQSRRNVGVLFDQNRLNDEIARTIAKLNERQLPDGRWSWFPGGLSNDYITLYIVTGYARLRHLGVDIDVAPAIRSLGALDAWMAEQYKRAIEHNKRLNELAGQQGKTLSDDDLPNYMNYTNAMYLYGRSFYVSEHPVAAEHQEALNFFLDQARRHWNKVGSLQSQGHLALALHRFGDRSTADRIMVSLKERSVSNEELGTYWKPNTESWWWYHAPIETQATLIEAFDEVAGDAAMVENCKVWLLKQKQTQNWKSTKATADSVYALLLRGTDLLSSTRLVEVKLGAEAIKPASVEAGTGYYEQRRSAAEVTPDLGHVTVTKHDAGVAWGSVHWQYFEDISRITASGQSPLEITKELYVKRNTDAGPHLFKLGDGAEAVRVGDELVVRLVLQSDRDLEFIHLKDHRGSGTEPVNVLSGYRYQDSLGYYESTRDTASHFFIEYLRKGTYVFEYSTRVQLRGEYQTGMASVQCMYAPEFNSHSQSLELKVE